MYYEENKVQSQLNYLYPKKYCVERKIFFVEQIFLNQQNIAKDKNYLC